MSLDDDLRRLHGCLGRERLLLEALAHRLWRCERARQAIPGPSLDRVAVDLEEIRRAVHAEDLVRALRTCALGTALGLGPEPTLDELGAALPAPWSSLVLTHGLALRAEVSDIEELRAAVAACPGPSGSVARLSARVLPPSLPRFVGLEPAA